MQQYPQWIRQFLNEGELEEIRQAVIEAEKKTSGEIVPMIVKSSSTIGHVFPMVFFLVLLVLTLFPGLYYLEGWVGLASPFVFLGIALPLSYFMAKLSFVQRWLTSRPDQIYQCEQRAEVEFFEQGLHQTQGDTGILIFVSLLEHKIVILADKAIHEKVEKGTWDLLVKDLTLAIKARQIKSGFVEAIKKCGDILAPHFPIQPDDQNELRDHLIVKY